MIMSISIDTTSTVQVRDGDKVVKTEHCFFPEVLSKVAEMARPYGTNGFSMIALHGPSQFTSRLFPVLQETFDDATIIIDGKDS